MGEITVKIVGTKPLLQNRLLSQPEEAEIAGLLDPETICRARLFKDETGGIYEPAEHIRGALIFASRSIVYKRRILGFENLVITEVEIHPEKIPLNSSWAVDSRLVRMGHRKQIRLRPRFDSWELNFKVIFNEELISRSLLLELLQFAGSRCGLGDYRPVFGLFKVCPSE